MENSQSALSTFVPQIFSKADRLRSSSDFAYLKQDSRRYRGGSLVIYFKQHQDATSKVGISVSSKVGNAVVRNRLKREVRTYFRLHKNKIPPSHYLFVVTRPDVATLRSSLKDFTGHWARS